MNASATAGRPSALRQAVHARERALPARRLLLAVASWGVLYAVMVPRIVWGMAVGQRPDVWTSYYLPGGALLLSAVALTSWWPTIRPLRGALLAYVAMLAGYAGMRLVGQQPGYAVWAQTVPIGLGALVIPRFGPVGLQILPVLLVGATLIGSRLTRRELHLVKGDLTAPIQRDLLFRSPQRWGRFARWALVAMTAGTALFLALGSRYSLALLPQVLANLPLIALTAGMNAFTEEFVFRAVLLARLAPVLGTRQANWLQATLFGLGHFYGTPSGPIGVLMATAMGWLNGKSVLETRGLAIAFLLHVVQDAVIFAFFVMAIP